MLRKLTVLSVVFGLALANPLAIRTPRSTDANTNALDVLEARTEPDELLAQLLPEKALMVIKILKAVIGIKVSAMTLAVNAIGWLASNAVVIAVGAVAALGFCKFTSRCSLNYEDYIPIAQLRSFATPENLDTAQRFLVSAFEKYAETKGRTL